MCGNGRLAGGAVESSSTRDTRIGVECSIALHTRGCLCNCFRSHWLVTIRWAEETSVEGSFEVTIRTLRASGGRGTYRAMLSANCRTADARSWVEPESVITGGTSVGRSTGFTILAAGLGDAGGEEVVGHTFRAHIGGGGKCTRGHSESGGRIADGPRRSIREVQGLASGTFDD